jgi:hypothetical protein
VVFARIQDLMRSIFLFLIFSFFVLSFFVFDGFTAETRARIVPGQVASSEFRANRRGARNLLVLVSNWAYARSPLAGPPNDAVLMERFFKSNRQGLGDYKIVKLQNIPYTSLRKELASVLEPGLENLIFHYSGHGVYEDGQSYLLMPDIESEKVLRYYSLASKQSLLGFLKGYEAKRTFLVFDMCDSGASQGKRGSVSKLRQGSDAYHKMLEDSEGIWEINAAKSAAEEKEHDGLVYGELTWHLVQGLKGGQADGFRHDSKRDGIVAVQELFDFVRQEIGSQMPTNHHEGVGIFGLFEYENRDLSERLKRIKSLLSRYESKGNVPDLLVAQRKFGDLKNDYVLDAGITEGIEASIDRLGEGAGVAVGLGGSGGGDLGDEMIFPPEISSVPASANVRDLYEHALKLASLGSDWEARSASVALSHYEKSYEDLGRILEEESGSDLETGLLLGTRKIEGRSFGDLSEYLSVLKRRSKEESERIESKLRSGIALIREGIGLEDQNVIFALAKLEEGNSRVLEVLQSYSFSEQAKNLRGGGRWKADRGVEPCGGRVQD